MVCKLILKPLVDELKSLWEGISIKVSPGYEYQVIHSARLCVACDLPASKKVGVFWGHAANLGCLRCLKLFTGGVGNEDILVSTVLCGILVQMKCTVCLLTL